MNLSANEISALSEAIESQNISIPEAIDLIKGNNTTDEQVKPTEEISLTVDYSQTVDQMIVAGKYDWKNSDIIDKHFPLPAELAGQKTAVLSKLFHFNRDISSEDAISEMNKAGYRPATLVELLALGEAQPDLQRQFPIIALGSVWRFTNGHLIVPCLLVRGNGRELDLGWLDGDWDADCRFFAVRK